MPGHKKAPSPETVGEPEGEGAHSQGKKSLGERLEQYADQRRATEAMFPHIEGVLQRAPRGSPEADEAERVLPKLRRCGTKLRFHDYYRVDELRLVEARSCDKHLLCPFCAVRRMSRTLTRYMERYQQVAEGRDVWLLTVTVRNGDDLGERFNHLRENWKKWTQKRRNTAKGKTSCALAAFDGAVYSYEFTNKGNGWHPHLHALVVTEKGHAPSEADLRAEWEALTGDSFMVDLRPVDKPESGFLEVLKYALKFADLTPAQTWEAHMVLRGKRLLGAWGCFYGVPQPETPDEDPLEGEPYREFVCHWLAERGYYDIQEPTYWEPDPAPEPETQPAPEPVWGATCRVFNPGLRPYRGTPLPYCPEHYCVTPPALPGHHGPPVQEERSASE